MPTVTYPTSATTQVANTTAYQPVQQSIAMGTVMPVPPCSPNHVVLQLQVMVGPVAMRHNQW